MQSPLGRSFINGCLTYNLSTKRVSTFAFVNCWTDNRLRLDRDPSLLLESVIICSYHTCVCEFPNNKDFNMTDLITYLCISCHLLI